MILVFDRRGAVYEVLTALGLGYPLTRVTRQRATTPAASLAIAATASEVPWGLVAQGVDAMVVTTAPNDDEALDLLRHGVVGYLDAAVSDDVLRRTVHACHEGGTAFSHRVISRWLRQQRACSRSHCGSARLTARQREILGLIASGLADKEIADRLRIATATAQKHVTNILERLGVPNRAAAVASVCEIAVASAGAQGSCPSARVDPM